MKNNNCIGVLFIIIMNFSISCNKSQNNNLAIAISEKSSDIERIEFIKTIGAKKIVIPKTIFDDFKNLKEINGIWKFKKSLLIISYKNGFKDTISTNGTIFSYKNRYYRRLDEKSILKFYINK